MAVRLSSEEGRGAAGGVRRKSTANPRSPLVKATAIHEKLIVKSASKSHCRMVVRLTDTTWYIS